MNAFADVAIVIPFEVVRIDGIAMFPGFCFISKMDFSLACISLDSKPSRLEDWNLKLQDDDSINDYNAINT